MVKVYLAAPLFTLAEQSFNLSLAAYLKEQGLTVFCPQVECQGKEGEDIYRTCLDGLSNSDLVVAILDGADADSGTCWECGYAVAKGIPVVAVRTDFRRSGDTGGFNAMLYYSAAAIVEKSSDLFPTIARTKERLVGRQ
ncbi:MAG: nucleoside 2-deoxyribosyltransferase [Gloeomargarita sp. SKYG116]|nr:nucleoside 2-deoxyribosyltransferase [Gloeomargarita sp. SKYG116]MDW8402417.1 nucleoside 2-deoxyribosyltransferase [Gloeomargarita sp. SKYGB_i_bin116]